VRLSAKATEVGGKVSRAAKPAKVTVVVVLVSAGLEEHWTA
jgi:hypothetical protein